LLLSTYLTNRSQSIAENQTTSDVFPVANISEWFSDKCSSQFLAEAFAKAHIVIFLALLLLPLALCRQTCTSQVLGKGLAKIYLLVLLACLLLSRCLWDYTKG
jgi:hypothetical protein